MADDKKSKQSVMIVHRTAPWVTRIGDQFFYPGTNKVEGEELIEAIKKTPAWKSETAMNPMIKSANMKEVKVKEESTKTFAQIVAGINADEGIALIADHGIKADLEKIVETDKRVTVVESATMQLENLED